MPIVLLVLMLVFPSLTWAAYQNPTVVSNARQGNGTVLMTFAFTGNAGEPTITKGYVIQQSTTATALRNWIDDTIKELDLVHTAATLAILQPGQTVPRLAKTTPAPTAKQVWRDKFQRYLLVKDAGIVAMSADIAALKADLEATYQAGFLTE